MTPMIGNLAHVGHYLPGKHRAARRSPLAGRWRVAALRYHDDRAT
ncbi:hypothetical protein [Burkholderia seminalis]|nr:hypothetical protein [Burkholderia seminalis]